MQPSLWNLPPQFDGSSFEPAHDQARLETQLMKVREHMKDGAWHTLSELHAVCGGSEAGISARLRDLRKSRNGGYQVERRRVSGGLWEYRMVA